MPDNLWGIIGGLDGLSDQELCTVAQTVAALLEARSIGKQEAAIVIDPAHNGQAAGGAGGHLEAKIVRGHGPYLYLRYWQGGRLRSKYIGKAGSARADHGLSHLDEVRQGTYRYIKAPSS